MEEILGNAPILAAAGFASQCLAASERMMPASMHDASACTGMRGFPKPVSITSQSRFSFGSEKNQGKKICFQHCFFPHGA